MNTKKVVKKVETENERQDYEIVAGPNKDALFDACKYAYSKAGSVSVEFAVSSGCTIPKDDPNYDFAISTGCYSVPKNDPSYAYVAMPVTDIRIARIEHEDGSGESFNLYGFCKADLSFPGWGDASYASYKFDAYYNSKSRKGWITFTK